MSRVEEGNHKIRYLFAGLLCTAWLIACLVVAESGLSRQSPAGEQQKTNCLNKKPKKSALCTSLANNVSLLLTNY